MPIRLFVPIIFNMKITEDFNGNFHIKKIEGRNMIGRIYTSVDPLKETAYYYLDDKQDVYPSSAPVVTQKEFDEWLEEEKLIEVIFNQNTELVISNL